MNEWPISFARPEWVAAVWVWLGVWLAVGLLERRGSDVLDRLISPLMQGQLVDRPSQWRRTLRYVLLGVSGLAMSIASMQPQMGERFVATPRVGAEIMVAIDVSRSMLADDAKPNRLERAKAEIRDLLGYLGDDHVGLIAFAGRASVLSPMTPDKSFLRLALDEAGPHSVPRGGTKLAEAIRRAVVGFGAPGPAQRALILITDGEDHDSFAVDAAKTAAEAGIKIIAIGFGDERGSEIFVRDPRTGARTQVRDSEGRPVISRLNGDLLRELALATDGAFVPAGTGVLDLASIYDAHISPLTRGKMDDRGRTIRDEAYQLFLLVAFICLLTGIWVAAGSTGRGARSLIVFLASLSIAAVEPSAAWAQPTGVASMPAATDSAVDNTTNNSKDDAAGILRQVLDLAAGATTQGEGAASETSVSSEESVRERFNRANAALASGELVTAATLLRDARREAPDDPELRFAATYNLGVTAVAQADEQQEADKEAALTALHEAADWFREAVGMRPDDDSPRHNLEVTLRRALMLADEIAQTEEGKIEDVLDALITSQRERSLVSAALLEEVVRSGELDSAERLESAFNAEATAQRLLLSEGDELAERIVRERDAIMNMSEETRAPDEALRAAQLEGTLVYLDSAIDRMGQTRRQLRQSRAERAYRRGAAALGELKRARDQLRDPVEQVGVLLEEVGGLIRSTTALVSKARPLPEDALGDREADARVSAFLTTESLGEEGRRLEERVSELGARLGSAAEQAAAASSEVPPGQPPAQGEPSPADREALKQALIEAAPLVVAAGASLSQATTEIEAGGLLDALGAESDAGKQLAEAQEAFFDLDQLLEVAHQDQSRLTNFVLEEDGPIDRSELAPALRDLQTKNTARATRLVDLLARRRATRIAEVEAAVEQSGEAPSPDPEAPDPVAMEQQRFEVAGQLLALAEGAMRETSDGLLPSVPLWGEAGGSSARARDHLDAIRTLFFTLVEHLRRLARDQVNLGDDTQEALALSVTESGTTEGEQADVDTAAVGAGTASQGSTAPPEPRGPDTTERLRALDGEQGSLEERAGTIADVLLEQAASAPAEAEAQGQPDGDTLRRAAEHVASAQLSMRDTRSIFGDPVGALPPATELQKQAVTELAAALALLEPPPPPEDQQQDEDQDSEDQQDSGEDEKEDQESESQQDESETSGDNEEAAEQEAEADPSQLLQGVRDREAQRRRDQERERAERRSQPVDRDW